MATSLLENENFREFIALLNSTRVKFLIVGACTVLMLGCDRRPQPSSSAKQFTEQEVTDFVKPGRKREEIVARFGTPRFSMTNGVDDITMFYNLPFQNPAVRQNFIFAGFQVHLTNDIVVDWSTIREDVRPQF